MRLDVQLRHGRRTVVDMGAGICKGRMRHTNLSRVFPTLPPQAQMKLQGVSIAFLSGAAICRRDGDWRSCLDSQGWMRLVVQLRHGRRTVVDMGAGICKGRMRHTNLSRVFPTLPPLPK
ncbi:hypothetical protein MTO96_023192 [Rhipicephalus appendiculatus]